ncbi:MAG: hypothetical protein ACJAUL_003919, partial [Paraglaciecola sp.]
QTQHIVVGEAKWRCTTFTNLLARRENIFPS